MLDMGLPGGTPVRRICSNLPLIGKDRCALNHCTDLGSALGCIFLLAESKRVDDEKDSGSL